MKLHSTKQKFESGGIGATKKFTVEVGAKLFKTLISSIYPDKIYAVIRELSTNAYEAHQEVGKPEIPFKVKLPSQMNTIFCIRDYGPGLSEEGVEHVYTRLFKSTKENSNEQGGAYGLGSKSPFCYVQSFIVHSYYEGFKYSYFMMIGKDGEPEHSLADKSPTTEPNGLEIILDVKKEDVTTFVRTAERVYKWFKTRPIVNGNTGYRAPTDVKTEVNGNGWSILASESSYNNNREAVAVMANVAYSLREYTGPNKNLLINDLVLYFDIGDVEPEPSREGLSFDKQTLKAIEDRLNIVKADFEAKVIAEVAGCEDYWAACQKYERVKKYIPLTNVTYKGIKLQQHLTFGQCVDATTGNKWARKYQYINGYTRTERHVDSISTSHKVLFILNDSKRGLVSRGNYYLNQNQSYSCALVCEPDQVDLFCESLHIDKSKLLLASILPAVPITHSTSRAGHATKVLKLTGSYSQSTRCWTDADVNIETGLGYYYPIKNNLIQLPYDGKTVEVHPKQLKDILTTLGITDTIYGFRPNVSKKIGENWQLPTKLIETAYKKYYNTVKTVVMAEKEYNYINSGCPSVIYFADSVKKLGLSNNIAAVANRYLDLKKLVSSKGNYSIIRDYGIFASGVKSYFGFADTVQLTNEVDKTLFNDIAIVKSKYPLLFADLESVYMDELVYYIKCVDTYGR